MAGRFSPMHEGDTAVSCHALSTGDPTAAPTAAAAAARLAAKQAEKEVLQQAVDKVGELRGHAHNGGCTWLMAQQCQALQQLNSL